MAGSDLQIGKLELAARALDLTTSLLKATSSSNFLLKGAWEIGQWLGRERLNQHELLDCMEKAKGLAFANENGVRFFDQVISGTDALPVGPLFLQQSGSLGRLMAGDPNLNWIVSTVAGLFQHHRDDRLVAAKLTALITEAHRPQGQRNDILAALDTSTYNPTHARLNAVVRKIVSSVWFNVVNVGCDTISLPQELLDLCPRGHYLEPSDFGLVINTIHARGQSKAVLRTDHLLRDVLLWLLLHYDGTIIVNVGGQIVYRADLGNPHRELEVRISSACSQASACDAAGKESYKFFHHISGSFEEFLSGASFSSSNIPPQPGVRQKLYEVPRPYPADSAMWNKGLQILVKCSAKSILRWLLEVPLFGTPFPTQREFSTPGFRAAPSMSPEAGSMTVSLILKRIPAMVNLQWGSSPWSRNVTMNPFGPAPDDETPWTMERRFDVLLGFFPVLHDLVRSVSAECLCPACSRSSAVSGALRAGCLKRIAVEEALLLLAHSVADGFGVNDVSSVSEIGPIVEGMAVILVELITEQKVAWDTWFTVASCVYLGCPFEKPLPPSDQVDGATSFAAIQFGNLATSAPWLDLTQELAVQGCFGLVASKGRLGVVTTSDRQQVQFRTVEENFAIIETEKTEDTDSFCFKYKKAASSVDRRFRLNEDESAVESDVILWQADNKFYRLLLRIKTKNHWRAVDPSAALTAAIQMPLSSARCQHGAQPPEMAPSTARVYTMDEVLGRWPDNFHPHASAATAEGDRPPGDVRNYYLTNVLETHLKKNVALALSVDRMAVLNFPELACLPCMLRHARDVEREPIGDMDGEGKANSADRYIINVGTQLADQRHGAWQLGSSVNADGGAPFRP